MVIGVPKEIKKEEYRVSLTPAGTAELFTAGNEVLVETGAGDGSGFRDNCYLKSGGRIVDREELFRRAEIIIKGKALGQHIVEVEIKYAPRVSGQATGAKLKLIVLTVRDIFRFWFKWILFGPVRASSKINKLKRRPT